MPQSVGDFAIEIHTYDSGCIVGRSYNTFMDKRLLVGIGVLGAILVVGAAAFGYRYYKKSNVPAESTGINALEQAGNSTDNLSSQASQGVLPSIDPQSNPMENAPDTNPVSKTNPYSGVKTNPFK